MTITVCISNEHRDTAVDWARDTAFSYLGEYDTETVAEESIALEITRRWPGQERKDLRVKGRLEAVWTYEDHTWKSRVTVSR